jgi:hypothetical protein
MWGVGRLRRIGLHALADGIETHGIERLHRAMTPEHLGLPDAAARLSADEGWDVVVMGHSHQEACRPAGDAVYANSGRGRPRGTRYVSVDTTRSIEQVVEMGVGPIREAVRRASTGPSTTAEWRPVPP